MGLGDVVSTVLTKFKADTSEYKTALKALRGEERQRHRDLLDEMEGQNKRIDSQIEKFAKIGAAVLGTIGAYKAAAAAARDYLEDQRLEAAAAGANIDALAKATRGLVEADTLLAFAGKAQNGVWKLNQGEMDTVLRGAMALRKTMGVELQPTVEALTEAVAKGNTRALKEFGIEAKDKAGLLQELGEAWQSVGGNADLAGDSFIRAQTSLADGFDDLKGAVGELVVALSPLLEMMASLVGLVAETVKLVTDNDWPALDRPEFADYNQWRASMGGVSSTVSGVQGMFGLKAIMDQLNARNVALGERDRLATLRAGGPGGFDMEAAAGGFDMTTADAGMVFPYQRDLIQRQRGGRFELGAAELDGVRLGANAFDRPGFTFMDGRMVEIAGGGPLGGGLDQSGFEGLQDQAAADARRQALLRDGADLRDLAAKFAADAQAMQLGQSKTLLSQLFGTPAEIDAQAEALKVAHGAFEGLTTAASAGFDAMITGSDTFAGAFRKALAEVIRGLANQMFVESLKHAAMGVGALAIGGPIMGATAAQHFAAAGMFGAGAVAAGAIAHGMGAGQSGRSGGGGGGGGGRAPQVVSGDRSGGDRGTQPINVYVGSEWANLPPTEMAGALQRAIRLGQRGSDHIRRH